MTTNQAELVQIARKHELIQSVPCPDCQAKPGEICRGPAGRANPVPHQKRRSAAADAGVYQP